MDSRIRDIYDNKRKAFDFFGRYFDEMIEMAVESVKLEEKVNELAGILSENSVLCGECRSEGSAEAQDLRKEYENKIFMLEEKVQELTNEIENFLGR